MTNEEIIARLEKQLSQKRFLHSISVAATARSLAQLYGADSDKAYLAGIVHDCAKCYTDKELYLRIQQYGIIPDSVELKNPKLLHALVGAYEAEHIYGIDDEEILDAVRFHTVGKADMSPICAIIYIADAIEPMRDYPEVSKLRETAKHSLDRAILEYTDKSIAFLIKKGEYIHPNAIETRNYYLGCI